MTLQIFTQSNVSRQVIRQYICRTRIVGHVSIAISCTEAVTLPNVHITLSAYQSLPRHIVNTKLILPCTANQLHLRKLDKMFNARNVAAVGTLYTCCTC